jgi:hypothetical protein
MILVLASCDNKTRCYVCNPEENRKAQEFVASNIKAANNMSDEEMEDVIDELFTTSIKLNCRQKMMNCSWDNHVNWSEVEKDSLDVVHCKIY